VTVYVDYSVCSEPPILGVFTPFLMAVPFSFFALIPFYFSTPVPLSFIVHAVSCSGFWLNWYWNSLCSLFKNFQSDAIVMEFFFCIAGNWYSTLFMRNPCTSSLAFHEGIAHVGRTSVAPSTRDDQQPLHVGLMLICDMSLFSPASCECCFFHCASSFCDVITF
jgi:hypothetical protein